MKKYFFFLLIIPLTILLSIINPHKVGESDAQIAQLPLPKNPQQIILESMSLEEKVGQLFMFGFYGTSLDENAKEFLTNKHIGSVILYKHNIQSDKQINELTRQIQSLAEIPILIAIDQEGGIVSRLTDNKVLTKAEDEIESNIDAYNTAYGRGVILKGLNINTNFSPVVEYITEKNSFLYPRVFRGTIEEVSQKGLSMIQGYTQAGIIAVPKHYPGHSNDSVDSHNDLPIVNISPSQWEEYIYPFEYITESKDTKALMVGHISYPQIDTKPSTISYEIITKRLRNDLNYQGVLITDDMEMGAMKQIGDYTDIAKQALLAGNDILLYTGLPEVQTEVYEYILNEVTIGNIDISIIDEKVLRILTLKQFLETIPSHTL